MTYLQHPAARYRLGSTNRIVRYPRHDFHRRVLRPSVPPPVVLPFRARVREWGMVGLGAAIVATVGYIATVLLLTVASS